MSHPASNKDETLQLIQAIYGSRKT